VLKLCFSFAQTIPTDIEKYISFNAIPSEYKGGKQIEKPYMENGCLYPKQLTKEDYLVSFQHSQLLHSQ
jgi:hypothetical protein